LEHVSGSNTDKSSIDEWPNCSYHKRNWCDGAALGSLNVHHSLKWAINPILDI
jgi:hypothetical protein